MPEPAAWISIYVITNRLLEACGRDQPVDTVSRQPVKRVDGQRFLANLEADPGEKIKVAANHPDLVERWKKLAL